MEDISKVDLSLDEIIALNRKEQKGKGRGRGRGRGRGQSPGGGGATVRPGGMSRTWKTQKGKGGGVAGVKTRAQQRARQLQSQARNTLLNKRRRLSATAQTGNTFDLAHMPKMATPQQSQQQGSGGTSQGSFTRGRGRGTKRGGRGGQGRGMGVSQTRRTTVVKVGSKIKLIRTLKNRGRGTRERGSHLQRGAANLQHQQAQQQQQRNQSQQGRGAGRGVVRGRGRGVGRGRRRLQQPVFTSASPKASSASSSGLQISVIQETEPEPVGVDLPLDFGIDHHTSQSLHCRFTPKTGQGRPQRMVLPDGRFVSYQN